MTADDVVFTFTKFQDPSYPGPEDLREVWEEISILRLDERNVQLQLPEQFAPFLDFMNIGLLPDHLLRVPIQTIGVPSLAVLTSQVLSILIWAITFPEASTLVSVITKSSGECLAK